MDHDVEIDVDEKFWKNLQSYEQRIGRKGHIFDFSLVTLQFQDWVRQTNEPPSSVTILT